jgi:hypothetical protein
MTRARTRRFAPDDGVLLRVPVGVGAWAESLPPVPGRHDVTVSFSCADAAAEHADALELLGYRVVGVRALSGDLADAPMADFLIPPTLPEQHPAWWGAIAGQADRAFSLALGPALAVLGDVLDCHLQTLH